MEAAKTYLDRALQLKPTDSMARYESAMLKSTSGDYDAAARQLEQLVKDDPNWLEPHVELATLYYRLHRPEDGAKERQIVDRLTAEQQAQGVGKR
jgi:tetratricopeptide (TPR) repeat protein